MSFRNIVMFLGFACILTMACHSAIDFSPNTSAPAQSTTRQPAHARGSQPSEAELQAAVNRNYEGAVTIDTTHAVSFLTGDFNGDNSEDVAIVVKPGKGKLP